MLFDKPKRKENVFLGELLEGEEILWMGQGDASRLLTGQDLFLIPFSLFWCTITIPMLISGFVSGNIIFILLPHGWIGLYMLFGRFVVKYWHKQHTYYAVTNQRLLILSTSLGHHVQSYDVAKLPSLKKSIGMGDVGSIVFGVEPQYRRWQRKQYNMSNTGTEMFGYTMPGFYDIHDAEEVYRLVAQLAHQSGYDGYEKAKPAYLPR